MKVSMWALEEYALTSTTTMSDFHIFPLPTCMVYIAAHTLRADQQMTGMGRWVTARVPFQKRDYEEHYLLGTADY